MPERKTRRLAGDEGGIQEAARLLRAGGLVAFPTETVYGLGAHALDPTAVAGIFQAKGRPADDPLIVHLADQSWLDQVARAVPDRAHRLAERFWPGPLTLVLPKQPAVPDSVTAGLATVGVRVPAHPLAHRLLVQADLPIAAPSANLFARPSPTRAEHVLDDLAGRIDAVLDGGPTPVGVESTIVDVSGAEPRLLRPGGIPAEAIAAVLGTTLLPPPRPGEHAGPQAAPGLLDVHYAPRTPLVLVLGSPSAARARLRQEIERYRAAGKRVGALLPLDDRELLPEGVHVEWLGAWAEPERSAARLFDALRSLDRAGLDVLLARLPADPERGLGRALADRLNRARQESVFADEAAP